MAKDVVVYSNDLNQISLGTLNEQEQNLLFSLLVRLKDKGHAPVQLTNTDLFNMLQKNYTNRELTDLVLSLKEHFFKLDFTQIIPQKDGGTVLKTINLFKTMEIKLSVKKEIDNLTLEVNEQFEYILNRLKSNFTKFQLANFLVLKGKYSKTLFRLLIQYKNIGKTYKKKENSIRFDWKEFKDLMGIPKSSIYDSARIEKQILKPAVDEISYKQLDLFTNYNDVEYPYFHNLKYNKIKKNPDKKTSPIVEIEFVWDRNDLLLAKQKDPDLERKEALIEAYNKAKELGQIYVDLWLKSNKDELVALGMDDLLNTSTVSIATPVETELVPLQEDENDSPF